MTKILIILVIAFTFEAVGVILLKHGLNQIGPRYAERKATLPVWKNILKLVGDWFTNKNILLGLLMETIFFILLLYLLSQRDVSFVWPLTALSFVITVLAAKVFLKEEVSAMRWSGVVLIVVGAALMSLNESMNEKAKGKPARTPQELPVPGVSEK